MACIFEADSILSGVRDKRRAEIRDGLQRQRVGDMEEFYVEGAIGRWGGKLCDEAATLLAKYQLSTAPNR